MAEKHDEPLLPKKEWEQPNKCKCCVWGRWDGVRQYCLLPECVKGKEDSNAS